MKNSADDALAEFSESLRLPEGAIDAVVRAAERSSFEAVAGSTRVVLPAALDKPRPGTWLMANYVTLVLTEQFVCSVRVARCTPLERARHQYHGLDKDDSGSLVMERKMLLGIAAVSMRARNPVHQAPDQPLYVP